MASSVACGILGLPNVGKSTLFNALTGNSVLAANYPFATIEPNTGVVNVPDERLEKLAALFNNPAVVPATIKFIDIAGLVKGASQGESLGNQFLSHIRGVDVLIHVVRAFTDSNVTNAGSSNPKQDIEVINTELVLADLQSLNNRLSKLEKEAKADAKLNASLDNYLKAREQLDNGLPLWQTSDIDLSGLSDLQLITTKKVIYLFNVDETAINEAELRDELAKIVYPANCLFACAKLESELTTLDETDKIELLKSYGQSESSLIGLVKQAYKELGLQSFLTAGDKEVRAWTIKKGATAKSAAGTIHKDFERGFIAAEIVNYDDLLKLKSFQAAKASGKVRTEGKDYMMQEGDVALFRFNV